MFHKDPSHQVYRAAALDRLDWLNHGFGTRASGHWAGPGLVTVRQIHSDRCIYADGRQGCLGEGDALVTDRPGPVLGVRTADCVPILMADSRGRAVAAVHAGWRGTARAISGRVVEEMQQRFGSRPEELIAAIGPGICAACYEVGPEVAREFKAWFPERNDLDGQTRIDLAEANRRQLIEFGLRPEHISNAELCTSCHPEEFFSHRREARRAGRMLSAIGIRG